MKQFHALKVVAKSAESKDAVRIALEVPEALRLLGPEQTVDALADFAGTIGYEILTSLGGRYARVYTP